jgi:hypothetical protein
VPTAGIELYVFAADGGPLLQRVSKDVHEEWHNDASR